LSILSCAVTQARLHVKYSQLVHLGGHNSRDICIVAVLGSSEKLSRAMCLDSSIICSFITKTAGDHKTTHHVCTLLWDYGLAYLSCLGTYLHTSDALFVKKKKTSKQIFSLKKEQLRKALVDLLRKRRYITFIKVSWKNNTILAMGCTFTLNRCHI
jgi:hypothetical protein